MSGAVDLQVLDRDVARAVGVLERHRAAIGAAATAEARDALARTDPFGPLRAVAGQTTFRALAALEPAAHERPHRDGLMRWVYELTQARLDLELFAADVSARRAVDPRLPRSVVERFESGDAPPPEPWEGPPPSYEDATRSLFSAPDAVRAGEAEERAAELAAPVAAVRKERRARRFEIARRLDASRLSHPSALVVEGSIGSLARALLDATEPIAASVIRDARRVAEGPWRASSAIWCSLATDAREGWPARPVARWLDDVFVALAPRGVPLAPVAAPSSGSGFLRAAAAWGKIFRRARAQRSMPFALARDPYDVSAQVFGFAMASAIASTPLQRKALEVTTRVAASQVRALHLSMLLFTRASAARVLLGEGADFEEMGARLFGVPLPRALEHAWPAPSFAREPLRELTDEARLAAILKTPAFVSSLVRRFDEDWYRNPKAGHHLTSLACGPAYDGEAPPEDAPTVIARAFEGALG